MVLVGVLLVGGALWARRRADPHRYDRLPRLQLEAWVANHPEDADALYALARLYRKESQITDARLTLERVQRLEPGNARVLTDLGELKAGQGDYAGAQPLFEQAIRLRPDLPEPYRNLGHLGGIARNYVLAIQYYRQALARQPDDVPTLISLGTACGDALNRGEAEAAFRKAIDLISKDPRLRQRHGADTYQSYGLALFKLGDLAGARVALLEAEKLGPSDPFTHLYLGLTIARQLRSPADEAQALEHLDRATQLGYTGGEDNYARGLVYLRRQQHTKAIASLEAAVRREGGGDDAHYRLARAYLAMGMSEKGQQELRLFDRLVKTQSELGQLRHELAARPGDTAKRRRLARLCLQTARYREALQHYRALTDGGAADAELFQGMARAATAVGDTRLAEQARASLRRLASGAAGGG